MGNDCSLILSGFCRVSSKDFSEAENQNEEIAKRKDKRSWETLIEANESYA